MKNSINRIGVNTGAVNGFQNNFKKEDAKSEEQKQSVAQKEVQESNVKAKDVLAFMAQQAVYAKPDIASAQRVYDIQKYVTPEQAKRIAGFIHVFENKVAEGLVTIEKEFGNKQLSEAAKYEMAASMVE